MGPWTLNRIIHATARGAIVGYPTDTIWGFGCHPLIEPAVMRILRIKNRSPDKGLILLSSRIEYCAPYLDVDAAMLETIRRPCERPTTWLVPASDLCPTWIRGKFPSVAIRITDHPLLQTLCDGLQAPLVSTSANRGGRPPVRNQLQMKKSFGDELDFIVTGFSCGGARASEIKSLTDGSVLRSGA